MAGGLSNERPHEYDRGVFLHRRHQHFAINNSGEHELVYSLDEVAREHDVDLTDDDDD